MDKTDWQNLARGPILFVFIIIAVGCYPHSPRESFTTEWLSADDFQERFDLEVSQGYYPVRVEGMLRDGLSVYRGEFKPFPSENFYFYSYYGWKEGYFVTRDRELKEAGFNRIWIQEFTDENGHKRFQGTWVK